MAGAAHFQLAAVKTMIGAAVAAIGAVAAPRVRHHHVIPRRKIAHRGADRMHHAGAFVAVHGGIRTGKIAVAAVQVGLAHAACHDADDQFVGAGLAELQRVDDERCRIFPQPRRR